MKKEDAKKVYEALNICYIFIFIGIILVESDLNKVILLALIVAIIISQVIIKRKFNIKMFE